VDSGAAVYRWVDEDGHVQFGDRPPQASSAEEIKIKGKPKPTPAVSGAKESTTKNRLIKQQRMLDAFREEREDKQQKNKERKEKQAKRVKDCAYAQDRLREYLRSPHLYEPLPDGKRRILTNEEAKKEIESAKRRIKRLCS